MRAAEPDGRVDDQSELFERAPPVLPEGLVYRENFISPADEAMLLAAIGELPLQAARYKGYTARRRVASYGSQYDFGEQQLKAAEEIPAFLSPLRERAAAWSGVAAAELAHALIAEYRPGTPLGWHRDVPHYEMVVGVSLAGTARMRFRPYPPPQNSKVITLDLAPRSAYLLHGPARWAWQHSIAATSMLRYSITFRTRRR